MAVLEPEAIIQQNLKKVSLPLEKRLLISRSRMALKCHSYTEHNNWCISVKPAEKMVINFHWFKALRLMDCLYIRSKTGFDKVHLDSILYIEQTALGVLIVTSKRTYAVAITLEKMEWVLPNNCFSRAHDSFLVNLECVIGFDEEKVFIDQREIPLSKKYKDAFIKRLNIIVEQDLEGYVEIPGFSLN